MSVTKEILQFTNESLFDQSIESYKYSAFNPIVGINLNNPGEINIVVELQNIYTHPSQSYRLVEGGTADGTAYAEADAVTLTNNGIMHLFNRITPSLANREIETISHPGQAI